MRTVDKGEKLPTELDIINNQLTNLVNTLSTTQGQGQAIFKIPE